MDNDPRAQGAVMSGYLLKKKRKKIQGMARRYFWLSPEGALSYSFVPNSPIRDSLFVGLSYVSASRKNRTFHIDSGKTVYHCKALTVEDFDQWAAALRTFVGTVAVNEVLDEETHQPLATPNGTVPDASGPAPLDLAAVRSAVAGMTSSIHELEALYLEFKNSEQHPAPPPSAGLTPSPNLPSPPSGKFKFLKKHPRGGAYSPGTEQDYFESKSSHGDLLKHFGQLVATLNAQHDAVLAATNKSNEPRYSMSPSTSAYYDAPTFNKTYASRSSAAFYPRNTPSRASSFSLASGETDDFYDAVPGEFVLEEEDSSDDESPNQSGFSAFIEQEEDESSDDPEEQHHESESTSPDPLEASIGDVERRSQLPAPVQGDEVSLLGLLRKNVGKDLATISFPVTMNEPLSALQRIAEELEYTELLDRAAETNDSIERLTLVAAFAIAGTSGNKYRSSRKPFNPLLGETFECIRPDKGFKFIAEKVQHQPPILAFHSEAKAWAINGYIAPTQKFWGRSMEVFVSGDFKITFLDTGETFSVRKPSSFVRNLVAGTKYLEVVGDMVITNEDSGESATIAFKEGSAWGGVSTRNKLDGKVLDAQGKTKVELVGRWDELVEKKEGKSNYTRLWVINDFPANPERYYGFSQFAVQLNELTPIEQNHVAPTDSRLRPDQLAMESGNIDEAEETKKRVEEKQREKRKALTETGEGPKEPAWFVREGEGWSYGGKYFETREKRAFEDPDIF